MTRVTQRFKKTKQDGTTSIEFALIGAVFMMVLFGVMEVGRLLYVWNTLSEVTRRGARVAAVCREGDVEINKIALFNTAVGTDDSSIVHGLSAANINVEYLDAAGAPTLVFADVEATRVSVSNFQHDMLIPFLPATLTAPEFSTTVPVESRGWNYDGTTWSVACF